MTRLRRITAEPWQAAQVEIEEYVNNPAYHFTAFWYAVRQQNVG